MHRSITLLGVLGFCAGCGVSSGAPSSAAPHSRPPGTPESTDVASTSVDAASQHGDPAEPIIDNEALPEVDLPAAPPEDASDDAPSFRYTLDANCKAPLSEFDGLYFHQFEMSAFHPFNKDSAVYWVSGTGDAMHRLASVPGSAIRVRGKLSGEGKHGHLGGYKRELYVCEVLDYEPLCKTPKGARLCKCVEDPTRCQ